MVSVTRRSYVNTALLPLVRQGYNCQVILHHLETTESAHLSATTVHRQLMVKGYKIALSTVYSNLHALHKAGLINEVYSVQGVQLFERQAEPHHHLLCRACGKVQDMAAEMLFETCVHDLEAQISARGWKPIPLQLTLVGHCPECHDAHPIDE